MPMSTPKSPEPPRSSSLRDQFPALSLILGSAAHGHLFVCPLRRQPQSRARRMVHADPCSAPQEGGPQADLLSGEVRDRRLTRRSQPRHAAGPPRACPAAVPLQHRRPGVRGRATHGRRSTTDRPRVASFSGNGTRKGRQGPSVPALAAHGAPAGSFGRWAPCRGAGLPQPARTTDHPLRHRPLGRSLRDRRLSPGIVAGRQARQPARDSPHHGDSPAACRRGPQHDSGMARPRQAGQNECLRRNRP